MAKATRSSDTPPRTFAGFLELSAEEVHVLVTIVRHTGGNQDGNRKHASSILEALEELAPGVYLGDFVDLPAEGQVTLL
jgi:hypothetical protein